MKFHSGEIAVQERAGVRDIANDVGESIIDFVPPDAAQFLARRQMVVLGTVDRRGRVWASVVTGEPGFVETVGDRTLRISGHTSKGDPLLENLAGESHIALFAPDFVATRRVRVNGRGSISGGAIYIKTDQVYGNCRRYMQERMIASARQSQSENAVAQGDTLSAAQQDQISRADTFFIATDSPDSGADVSHKGGNPGFVKVVESRRLAFPDYNGNRMFNTLGNIALNPRAGLLFIDFESGRTLQLTGKAAIDWNSERAKVFPGAERVVDFELEEIVDSSTGFPLTTKFRQFSRYNPAS